MKVEHNGVGAPGQRSYKEVALTNLSQLSTGPPPSLHVSQLIKSLQDLLSRNPDGVTLTQARRSCPLLLSPDMLQGYPSVRQLLVSMPTVVRLQGFGVQTRIFPPDLKRS